VVGMDLVLDRPSHGRPTVPSLPVRPE
jgi:hypothetical protein